MIASRALGLALAVLVHASAVTAQNPAHVPIGSVADGFVDTPNGRGLLPTAVAEAEIAIEHSGLAAADLGNLEAIKRHTGHVLHALDPSLVQGGPGLGYGVKRAAEGVIQQIELAATVDGASENVRTHAVHIAGASRGVLQRADRIIALARQIQATNSGVAAATAVQELNTLTQALVSGRDADADGRIGWQETEGGLRQVQQHVTLLKRGEGLTF